MKPPAAIWRIWRMPVLLAVVSGSGLIAALLSGGMVSDLAWTVAVALPLLVLARVLARNRAGS